MKLTHSNNQKNKKSSLRTPLLFFILNSSFLILLASCHKNCVCQGYDGSSYTYTEEEVDARNVTCSNMIFQAGQQFYAICEWE